MLSLRPAFLAGQGLMITGECHHCNQHKRRENGFVNTENHRQILHDNVMPANITV